jgi:hypothetical protein
MPCWGGRACRSSDFQNKYSNNIAAQKLCYVAFEILLLFSTYTVFHVTVTLFAK